jgi:outer membrane receptor for ferrienterochelin and colicins
MLTLIDGRPVNTPRDGLTDFNQIPLSNIERVEVLRGPASNIYGANAVGGVINIITKSGSEKMRTEVLSESGSFSTNHASLAHGYKVGKVDYFLTYDYLGSHGHRNNAAYRSNDVTAKLGYSLNDENKIWVAGGFYKADTGAPGPITNENLQAHQDNLNKYVDLTYSGKLIAGQSLYLKLFHTTDQLEYIRAFDPLDKDTHRVKVYGTDAQISQKFFDIFRTSIGASFQEQFLNSTNSGKHSCILKGLYVEAEMDFLKQGALKFGARWDDYSTFGDTISPSASMYFWLFDTIKLHALAAKSFRAPTFNALYWPREDYGIWGGVEGNPDIKPEKAISYEAGLSTYIFKKFKTDVTLFKNKFKDLIEWSMDSTFWWRPNNVSSAVTQGVETEIEYDIQKQLKAKFNYTYLEARNSSIKKKLAYRPRNLYKLSLIYTPFERWEFGVSALYKGSRYADTDNTITLKGYTLVNFNTAYKINPFMQLFFEVKDIFDRTYQDELNYSMPGRAFYGGVKIDF